ncbi:amidohydrolase family protein [Gryllotalpicola reticulitermitis]|uniref:Amidohydrolase family protein n=1 Tax=Gryllotalpicola reticulitermitis TaxID=1184153 RepID=A0ABV8Q4B4_9MICO
MSSPAPAFPDARTRKRAVVDGHHHLWAASGAPTGHEGTAYGVAELLGDSGERPLIESVFVECGAMYRAERGPLRQVGETEYAASEGAGRGLCGAIVASADLSDVAQLPALLDAHALAARRRLRGIRHTGAWDASPEIPNGRVSPPEGLYRTPEFARGVAELAARGLSFEAWSYQAQLGDIAVLTDRVPDALIVVDHCGGPLGAGPYSRHEEAFQQWRAGIDDLARRPNVHMKLGGLGMRVGPLAGRARFDDPAELAEAIRPYIVTALEAFGADRAMFESNFPMDRGAYAYETIWDAFEVIAQEATAAEQDLLFGDTATRVYRLGIDAELDER